MSIRMVSIEWLSSKSAKISYGGAIFVADSKVFNRQDDDPITPSVLLGRPQTPSLIQCDDNFEYTTEAYEWRRGMEDRSWAGCKVG